MTGTIKAWFGDRGFGFITPDSYGEDVFVHVNDVQGYGGVAVGAGVEFELAATKKGPRARNVIRLEQRAAA